ncbi:SCO3242 family prenyltransferase [Streptomyces solicavernae]
MARSSTCLSIRPSIRPSIWPSTGQSPRPPLGRARDWAELLRISALFTVPGDALAGAAAIGVRPNTHTLAAIGSSLCLYEAGMALNDWADHAEDAVERPHRPLPSGRIPRGAALAAAGALTATGLGLAARAGRPALTVAGLLAGSVWAYDLKLKHTAAGPATMATARGLDLLLGAVASGAGAVGSGAGAGAGAGARAVGVVGAGARAVGPGAGARAGAVSLGVGGGVGSGAEAVGSEVAAGAGAGSGAGARAVCGAVRCALPSSVVLAAHTLAVTTVSRREAQGGSSLTPLAALAATALLGRVVGSPRWGGGVAAGVGSVAGVGSGSGVGSGAVGGGAGFSGGVAVGGGVAASGASAGPAPGGLRSSVPGRATLPTTVRLPGPAALGLPGPASVRLAPHHLLGAAYVATAARPLFHAVLNPSPQLTQRAVGGGIRAMIPLQSALAARAGSLGTALATAALAPVARRMARRVSAT